jgi:hemerythrin
MSFMEWSESLSVGVSEIDNQHKQLIKLINLLFDAMGKGQGKEILSKTLSELINYTKMHFANEEKYMQMYKYSYYLSHKAEHDKLTKQVLELNQEFNSGNTLITVKVMNFLKDWLKTHIQQNDVKFGHFLNSTGKV